MPFVETYHPKSHRDHTNRAGRKAVRNWQYRLNRFVPCLEGAGLTVLMQDEAFFMHDAITGRKYWALRDRRISVAQAKAIRSLRQKILQSVVLHPSLALPMALVCPKRDQY